MSDGQVPAPAASAAPAADGPWKGRLAVFLTSQILSLFGSGLVQYALMWYVTLETKSGLYLTLYTVAGFLPAFLLSPFGGVWADRHDRKRLIMLADGMIAVVTLALAAVFTAGGTALWLIMLAAAVRAAGQAVHSPALGALTPKLVPAQHLARVNGLSAGIQAASMLVCPALSGILISIWPLQWVFLIDVATAAVAISLLAFFVKVDGKPDRSGESATGHLEDLRLGFAYVRGHRYLVGFFAYLAVLLFLISPAAFLTPLQVARSYGGEVWRLTAIEIAFAAGMLAGGGLLAAWGGFRNRLHTMVLSAVLMGACTVGLGLAPPFWLYLAVMGLFGIALPAYNTPSATLIQEHVEDAYLGRVFSVLSMISTSAMPLGMILFGPLAEVVSIEWLLLITGVLIVGVSLAVTRSRRLMEAGQQPEHGGAAGADSQGGSGPTAPTPPLG